MAKADRDRLFYGTIQWGFDFDGVPVVYGRIKVLDGFVCAMASTREELGEKLDEMVLMVLDYDIHKISGHDFIVSSN